MHLFTLHTTYLSPWDRDFLEKMIFLITSSPLVKTKVLLTFSQNSHFNLSYESLILVNFLTRYFLKITIFI